MAMAPVGAALKEHTLVDTEGRESASRLSMLSASYPAFVESTLDLVFSTSAN